MRSIGCGIEKTKALVETGADINYKTKLGTTAAIVALSAGGGNRSLARQGVNYWETKINKRTLEQIKKLYPDTWEEYIKKY